MPKIISEDEVFTAVIGLLVAKGYDRATTSEMAAAAGIHEATLFRKYGSKAGLIERAIEHQLATIPLSRVSYTGNLQADLMSIMEAYVATVEMYGEIMPIMLLEVPRHPELRNALRTPMANIQGIVLIVDRYQREGLLRKESPLMSVNVLLAPIMVGEMVRRAQGELPPESINLQEYVDAFLRGHRRPE